MTRDEALTAGVRHYFTGKPCKYGHVAKRLVSSYECTICGNIKVRRWYRANIEKGRATARRYAQAHPEKQREQTRKRRANNPDYFRRYVQKWRTEHPEQYNARVKRWRAANRDVVRSYSSKRRARQRQAEGSFTKDDIKALFKAQKGGCLCKKRLSRGYHVDHKIPLSRGGSNWPTNLQLLCGSCNDSKGTKTMDEWQPGGVGDFRCG